MPRFEVITGECREVLAGLPAGSVHCAVTSPPYLGLRDYGTAEVDWPSITYTPMAGLPEVYVPAWRGQLGLEPDPQAFVGHIVAVCREVYRVLRDDGTLWMNFGDSYATRPNGPPGDHSTLSGSRHAPWEARKAKAKRGGSGVPDGLKHKDLMGIPWRVALALQADGWYLRSDIVWHKTNPMPESVDDRPTKAHEYIFLLTKAPRYFYDAIAIKEPVTGGAKSRGHGKHPKSVEVRNGVKANESFALAVRGLVSDRNKRTVWTVATQPYEGAHFATFAPRLIEPCILAGTSEKGCCPACGGPWTREVETYRTVDGEPCDSLPAARTTDKGAPTGAQGVGHGCIASVTVTTGWSPGCACDAGDPVPCTVLDFFNGAGSTGVTANRLGRDYCGIEVNPDYAAMSRARILGDRPLFNTPA